MLLITGARGNVATELVPTSTISVSPSRTSSAAARPIRFFSSTRTGLRTAKPGSKLREVVEAAGSGNDGDLAV